MKKSEFILIIDYMWGIFIKPIVLVVGSWRENNNTFVWYFTFDYIFNGRCVILGCGEDHLEASLVHGSAESGYVKVGIEWRVNV